MRLFVLGGGFSSYEFARRGYNIYRGKVKTEKDLGCVDSFDVIINCAGKSQTRWCESNRENFMEALEANALLVKMLSDYCFFKGKRFVHISTGCLYSGEGLKKEDGFLEAHCAYTVTKWAGEMLCREDDLIVRPRLLFADFVHPKNFLCRLPKFKKFIDEKNSYTSLKVLVDAIEILLKAGQKGVFNVACDGAASPLEIAKWLGIKEPQVMTETDLHKQEGIYLVHNVMDLGKLKQFYQPPDLKTELLRCFQK